MRSFSELSSCAVVSLVMMRKSEVQKSLLDRAKDIFLSVLCMSSHYAGRLKGRKHFVRMLPLNVRHHIGSITARFFFSIVPERC